jgi:hypothetical protein
VIATSQATTAPPVFNPNFAMLVTFASGGRVHSAQVNATADGRFALAGSLGSPNITGTLNLRKGTFSFPTATFRIQPTGLVNFVYNPPDQTSERINVRATTSITVSPTLLAANLGAGGAYFGEEAMAEMQQSAPSPVTNGSSQRYDVTLEINGDLSVPNGLHLDFSTNPPGLPEQVILASLGGQEGLNSLLVSGNVQSALQDEARTVFTGFAVPGLLSPVESNIAEAFGLQDFNIDYQPNQPLLISVTKNLGSKFDVRYTRYLSGNPSPGVVTSSLTPLAYTVSLDYNFTNRFQLTASTDDQHDNGIALGGTLNF